jgi:hypothetical protein
MTTRQLFKLPPFPDLMRHADAAGLVCWSGTVLREKPVPRRS